MKNLLILLILTVLCLNSYAENSTNWTSGGLLPISDGDGLFDLTTYEGYDVISQTGPISNNRYLYIKVQPPFADFFKYSESDAKVELTLYDDTAGTLGVQYSTSAGPYEMCSTHPTLTGSKQWTNISFDLPLPTFKHQQNYGADFRMFRETSGSPNVIVREIKVTQFPLNEQTETKATARNIFTFQSDKNNLPVQPVDNDLAQSFGTTNILTGSMHAGWPSNNLYKYLFNATSNGEYGVGYTPDGRVLFADSQLQVSETIFDTPKTISEIRVFGGGQGDGRCFVNCKIYFSTDGTVYKRFIVPGTTNLMIGSGNGDDINNYPSADRANAMARVYCSDGTPLAQNVKHVKLVFRPASTTGSIMELYPSYDSVLSPAIREIDIIGTVPIPTTIYVGTEGISNGSNYFTTIQDAVDVSNFGGLIIVSNGIYNTGGKPGEGSTITNRVFCDIDIEIRSVDGPDSTIIVGAPDAGTGGNGPGAVRCGFFAGATLSGFTLSNGYTLAAGDLNSDQGGGGARIRKATLITNCIIVSCSCDGYGGGINLQEGTVADCRIYNNYSDTDGGGFFSQGGVIYNSVINENEAIDYGGGGMFYSVSGEGGGIYNSTISGNESYRGGGISMYGAHTPDPGPEVAKMYDCTVASNNASEWAGGIYIQYGGDIHRTKVYGNQAASHNGGGIYLMRGGKVYDSLIYKNMALQSGGGIFFDNVHDLAVKGGEVYNCTVVANSAMGNGGGINMGNSISNYFGKIVNSIIFTNTASINQNWAKDLNGFSPFNCTGPLNMEGAGNITNNPEFVSIELGDWRLLSTSPCINAGTNGEVTTTVDLDGNLRIEEGTVDMGCYESIPEPTIFVLFTILGLAFLWKKK